MEIEMLFAAALAIGLAIGLGTEYIVALKKTKKLFEAIDEALADGELTEEEAIEIVRKATSVKDAYQKLWGVITMAGVRKR